MAECGSLGNGASPSWSRSIASCRFHNTSVVWPHAGQRTSPHLTTIMPSLLRLRLCAKCVELAQAHQGHDDLRAPPTLAGDKSQHGRRTERLEHRFRLGV